MGNCRRAQGNAPLGSVGRRQRRLEASVHGERDGFVGSGRWRSMRVPCFRMAHADVGNAGVDVIVLAPRRLSVRVSRRPRLLAVPFGSL